MASKLLDLVDSWSHVMETTHRQRMPMWDWRYLLPRWINR